MSLNDSTSQQTVLYEVDSNDPRKWRDLKLKVHALRFTLSYCYISYRSAGCLTSVNIRIVSEKVMGKIVFERFIFFIPVHIFIVTAVCIYHNLSHFIIATKY